jgi:heme exporter protein D
MQFDSLSAFIDMGGYGFFVWLSYGAALMIFVLLLWQSVSSDKQTRLNILKKFQRDEKLRQRAQQNHSGASK